MKNLIISTFLILATLAGGLMNYVPGELSNNLFGAVQASAQLKDPKKCDSANGQVPYGEFVVESATIAVVERDGKAGTPLPKNILVDAIKKSGFQDLAGKTDDQIIELAVKERRCVISPINYVAVVVNGFSAVTLTYCGLSYTTKGNTFSKVNGQIVADAEGYGAYNVQVQCKLLPCPSGTITVMTNGVQECKTPDTSCPTGQLKDKDGKCVTPPPATCPPGTSGTYPDCKMPCPAGTVGTFMPDCKVGPTPPPTPEAPKYCNPNAYGVYPNCVICPGGTPSTPPNNTTVEGCGKTEQKEQKKGGNGFLWIGLGAAAIACVIFCFKGGNKTPPPPVECKEGSANWNPTTKSCNKTTTPPPSSKTFCSSVSYGGSKVLEASLSKLGNKVTTLQYATAVRTNAANIKKELKATTLSFTASSTKGCSITTKTTPTKANVCPSPKNGGFAKLAEWLRSKNGKVTQAEYNQYVSTNAKSWETSTRKNIRAVAGCGITFEKPSIPQTR
jgi:hypothetical protein